MRRRLVLVLAAALVVGLVGLAWTLFGRANQTSAEVRIPDTPAAALLLMTADRHGAVALNASGTVGFSRGSGEAWSVPSKTYRPVYAACFTSCPSAVLSSDSDSANFPLEPDPAPLPMGGAQLPARLSESRVPGKLGILAASSRSVLSVASTARGAPAWHVLTAAGRRSYPIDSTSVYWFPASSGTAAVASWDVPGGSLGQQLWVRRRGVWRPVGAASEATSFGCTSGDGHLRLLDGRHLLRGSSRVLLRPAARHLSNCALTRSRLVAMAYSSTSSGSQSVLSLYDSSARKILERTFDSEMAITADSLTDEYCLTGNGVAHVYNKQGREIAKFPGVTSALFADDGSLVVAKTNGQVKWLNPVAPRSN